MQQYFETLKNQIIQKSKDFKSSGDDLEDFKDSELIELEVEQLIINYCIDRNYLVNGFPNNIKSIPEGESNDNYFCRERYQLYLDTLAVNKEDVAELMWCYISSFWSDLFENKNEYLQNLIDNLNSEVFYDVTI